MNETDRVMILDVPLDIVDMEQAAGKLAELMRRDGCSIIVTPNSEIVVNAGKDTELKGIISTADLIIPDGIGLVYASKLLGFPLKERVTGIDFLYRALGLLEKEQKSVFLLGGRPQGKGALSVAETAAMRMKERFPGLRIAGIHHGYFNDEEELKIVEEINRSGADFLCVALGSPKQEKFMGRYRGELLVKAAIGVGGSLDVWAGTVKRAPKFFRDHGLEWFYRFVKQPARYKRIAALPKFMIKVLISR
ncbi:MAG TPA: WecB/TagA/CpsF family glycosyltransferase [Bacillota bacterium]|nr:WecB/TagA/CpsF family glycosyltransferase [Bacillota bacterium]